MRDLVVQVLASLSIAGTVLLPRADAALQADSGGGGSSAAAASPSPVRHAASSRLSAVHPPWRPLPRCVADAALATAIAPILRHRTGSVAVGISDLATGVTASYGSRTGFHTASIVKVDILAALLLQTQRRHIALDQGGTDLATEMIESSDNDAASTLWDAPAERQASLPRTVTLVCAIRCPIRRVIGDLRRPRSPTNCACWPT